MTAKEYLGQAYRLDQRIDAKLEQVANLRALATKATATMTDMPRSSSPNLQHMEGTIVKIIDLEQEINEDIDRLVDLKKEITNAIKTVSVPEYQVVLELRYLCYKRWEEIAVSMNYTTANVFLLHGKALREIHVPA